MHVLRKFYVEKNGLIKSGHKLENLNEINQIPIISQLKNFWLKF